MIGLLAAAMLATLTFLSAPGLAWAEDDSIARQAVVAPLAVQPAATPTAPPVLPPLRNRPVIERVMYDGNVACDDDSIAPVFTPVYRPAAGVLTVCYTITNSGTTTINPVQLIDGEIGVAVSLGSLEAGASMEYQPVFPEPTEELFADLRGVFLDSEDLELELDHLVAAGVITADSLSDYFEITDLYSLAGQGPDGVIEVELATQIQKWESLGIENYEFVYRNTCFCSFDRAAPPPWRVRVEGGEVAWAKSVETNKDVPGMTISGIFAAIQERQNSDPDRFIGEFDLLYGYPTSWHVDPSRYAIDEEFGQVVESFELVQASSYGLAFVAVSVLILAALTGAIIVARKK